MTLRDEAVQELEGLATAESSSPAEESPSAEPEVAASPPPEPIETVTLTVNGQEVQVPINTEIPFKHAGQMLRHPISKLLNTYRQDLNLSDRQKELAAQREAFEKERGDLDTFNTMKEKYGTLQDWSEQNPEQWDRLWQIFQQKDIHLAQPPQTADGQPAQAQPIPQQVLDYIGKLEGKLTEHDKRWSEWEKHQEETAQKQDVEAIRQEVEDFAKQWPEVNLQEKDEIDNMTLETRIMKHGIDNDIRTFKLAALDFLAPQLRDIALNRGRTEAVKGVVADRQQGVIARSSTPFSGQGQPEPSKMTSAEKTRAAKEELAAALQGSL